MTTSEDLLRRAGIRLASTKSGDYTTVCPRCSAGRSAAHRKTKCLSVKIDGDGVCWNCHHCGWTGPEKGSGGAKPELVTYVYRDSGGTPRFRKARNLPGREPRFWLERA